jgi:acylphosphatase
MGSSLMVAKSFVIQGRVQGVGFRYFVMREAQALGLAGWVRNLPDGCVEVLAAGEVGLVDALEGRLWHGPPHARVTAVEGREAEPVAATGFRVLPTPW